MESSRLLPSADVGSVMKLFDDSFCSMNYRFTAKTAPWGISRFQRVDLAGVGVFYDEGYGSRSVARTRAHILDDSRSDFIVVIPLQRHSSMRQYGAAQDCGPGCFRVLSTAVPFAGHVVADAHDKYAELLAKIPGAMLREPVPRIDEVSNLPLPLRRGAGQLMKSLFELALAEGAALSDAVARDFSATLVRTIAAAVQESYEFERKSPESRLSSAQRTREKAEDFILRNLANAELDGKAVAAHCQVSDRYLRAVFAPSATVSGFIREARLQQCRVALRDPSLASRTVAAIASAWGFPDPASFNRIFKTRFGVTPGEYRSASGGR